MILQDERLFEKCVGCEACLDSCKFQAIEWQLNPNGYSYPHVDMHKCVGCGACSSTCQIGKTPEKNNLEEWRAFTFSSSDEHILKESSSGGFCTSLSKAWLTQQGVVYGVAQHGTKVTRERIDRVEQLCNIQKSKYVKSLSNGCFSGDKKDLLANRKVLFIGLPCELFALKLFLGEKLYKKVCSVALFCGGNVSPYFYGLYIEYLEKKFKSKILWVDFRCKKYGTDILCSLASFENGRQVVLKPKDDFFILLLGSRYVRPACTKCTLGLDNLDASFITGDFFGGKRGNGLNIVFSRLSNHSILSNLNGKIDFQDIESLAGHISCRSKNNMNRDEKNYKELLQFSASVNDVGINRAIKHSIFQHFSFKQKVYNRLPARVRGLLIR